ncbi:histidine phosphatase family protein [Petroclostridium sp. X23]|uniref:histidine phosphatase family protein n=1 Tax=Petroclostridium sp. X23 TaxID=3045146 RepID=UPI0024AE0EC3|nr:histidine phosphatase family protein [Petroclostridium sp. X23]WHH59458.1 histidine phosphatase family protein [Petroclostridium sp. X23]
MMKLFFIRHGLTEWNKVNRFQGSSNIPLCDEGVEQAKKISKRLSKLDFDAVFASDLDRAFQTANYIAEPHHMQVTKFPELREIHFGAWEGLTREEIINLKEYDFNQWKMAPHIVEFPGEGTLYKVQQRVMAGINKIIDEYDNGNIIIVSHGASLKIAILSLLDMDLSHFNQLWLGNTSLSIIEIRKDRNVLGLLNDTSHLDN